jgi:exosortase/archaeosortase
MMIFSFPAKIGTIISNIWDTLFLGIGQIATASYCQALASFSRNKGLLSKMKEDIKDAAMHFIIALPLSYEFTVIMVVINRLSKYSRFFGVEIRLH